MRREIARATAGHVGRRAPRTEPGTPPRSRHRAPQSTGPASSSTPPSRGRVASCSHPHLAVLSSLISIALTSSVIFVSHLPSCCPCLPVRAPSTLSTCARWARGTSTALALHAVAHSSRLARPLMMRREQGEPTVDRTRLAAVTAGARCRARSTLRRCACPLPSLRLPSLRLPSLRPC